MKPFSVMYGIDVATLEIEVALFSQSIATLSNTIDSTIQLSCYLHQHIEIFMRQFKMPSQLLLRVLSVNVPSHHLKGNYHVFLGYFFYWLNMIA